MRPSPVDTVSVQGAADTVAAAAALAAAGTAAAYSATASVCKLPHRQPRNNSASSAWLASGRWARPAAWASLLYSVGPLD